MTYDFLATHFYVRANWPGRRESPSEIADRLRRFIDALAASHETLKAWSVGCKLPVPYPAVRDDLASLIEQDVMRSDDGQIEREVGYGVSGLSGDKRELYSLGGCVGGGIDAWPLWNRIDFTTISGRSPDPSIVTYRLMKAVMLATIACWEPVFCLTGSSDLVPTRDEGWYFKAWITYVPPADAAGVDLVGVPFSERTPDGGLLLSATEQAFDAHNPTHVQGARIISNATRHLNAKLPTV